MISRQIIVLIVVMIMLILQIFYPLAEYGGIDLNAI